MKLTRRFNLKMLSIVTFSCATLATQFMSMPMAHADNMPVIGVAVADQKSLFYIAAVDGMRAAAKKAGYRLKIVSASDNSTLQINQIQNLLVQHISVLIFIPQDATSAAAGLRAANQADVPVIAVDERPDSGNGKLVTYIATNSVKAAHDLCTWMFNKIGGKGELAILTGVLGATAQLQRSQGCNEALAHFPNIHVVAQQTANWDETEAYKAAQDIITAHPHLTAIFGESDAMALGAAKAAKQAGRNNIFIVGIDGFPTMFQAIKDGLTQATKAQRPYEMGEIAVDDAVKIIKGQGAGIPPLQYIEAQLITRKDINQFKPSEFYGPHANSME